MKRCVSVLRVPGLVPLVAEIETTVAVEGVNRESVVSWHPTTDDLRPLPNRILPDVALRGVAIEPQMTLVNTVQKHLRKEGA